jgi:hypothetical protein
MSSVSPPLGGKGALLERVREALTLRHYSSKTSEAYVGWVRRVYAFSSAQPASNRNCIGGGIRLSVIAGD